MEKPSATWYLSLPLEERRVGRQKRTSEGQIHA